MKLEHMLYEKGDEGIPAAVLDRNGDVALSMCKVCGKAESVLSKPCKGYRRVSKFVTFDDQQFNTEFEADQYLVKKELCDILAKSVRIHCFQAVTPLQTIVSLIASELMENAEQLAEILKDYLEKTRSTP